MNATEIQQKSRTNKSFQNYRVVAESGTDALNFDYISQLGSGFDQKWETVKKKQQARMESLLLSPTEI